MSLLQDRGGVSAQNHHVWRIIVFGFEILFAKPATTFHRHTLEGKLSLLDLPNAFERLDLLNVVHLARSLLAERHLLLGRVRNPFAQLLLHLDPINLQ